MVYTKTLLSILVCLFISCFEVDGQIITTIAGNGTQGYSGDYLLATDAQIFNVAGIISDRFGNIYLADNGNSNIRKLDASGIITTFAGTGLSSSFNGDNIQATDANITVIDVAVDDSGNVFFPDGSFRIRKISAVTGIITTIAGTGILGFSGDNVPASSSQIGGIVGISIDVNGNIYLADYSYHKIRKINPSGILTTICGSDTTGFSGDNGPATNAEINISSTFCRATSDNHGNVYFPDTYNKRIRKIDTNGIITTIAGTGIAGYNGDGIPATSAQIHGSTTVYNDKNGNIFFNDLENRIRKINSVGIISTYAGLDTIGFSGDGGLANHAHLNAPESICFDSSGILYLSDAGNARIRKITPSTVADKLLSPNRKEIAATPNPNNGKFTICLYDAIPEKAEITIKNVLGDILQNFVVDANKPNELQLNLPKGIYILSAQTTTNNYATKIIIQ